MIRGRVTQISLTQLIYRSSHKIVKEKEVMAKRIIKKKPAYIPAHKKVDLLKGVDIDEINYKNVELLKKFIQDRGKIRSREITGATVQQQHKVARAIKNARELALLPFVQVGHSERKGRR
jgi:small subunit ribosomal protein S18